MACPTTTQIGDRTTSGRNWLWAHGCIPEILQYKAVKLLPVRGQVWSGDEIEGFAKFDTLNSICHVNDFEAGINHECSILFATSLYYVTFNRLYNYCCTVCCTLILIITWNHSTLLYRAPPCNNPFYSRPRAGHHQGRHVQDLGWQDYIAFLLCSVDIHFTLYKTKQQDRKGDQTRRALRATQVSCTPNNKALNALEVIGQFVCRFSSVLNRTHLQDWSYWTQGLAQAGAAAACPRKFPCATAQ